MSVASTLTRARGIVSESWKPGGIAFDASGFPVDPKSSKAARWSLGGAIMLATSQLYRSDRSPDLEAGRAAYSLSSVCFFLHGQSFSIWEDAPGRTSGEVCALIGLCLLASRIGILEPLVRCVANCERPTKKVLAFKRENCQAVAA